jgi:hypothetical protein
MRWLFMKLIFLMCAARLPSVMSELATFGAGCFWCVEAQLGLLKGVSKVVSGYTGEQQALGLVFQERDCVFGFFFCCLSMYSAWHGL